MSIEFQMPMEAGLFDGKGFAALAALKAKALAVVEAKLEQYKTDGIKLPAKDEFLKAARAFYLSTIIAYDIPGIGPVVEKMADEALLSGLMKLTELAYDRFAS